MRLLQLAQSRAAGRRVQLLAGPGVGGRGRRASATRRRAQRWIGDLLDARLARGEAPVAAARCARLRSATTAPRFDAWNAWFSRVARNRRAARRDAADGLLAGATAARPRTLDDACARCDRRPRAVTLPGRVRARRARARRSSRADALAAYSVAWLENQVLAAMKAVPLGQTRGQRMLLRARRSDSRRSSTARAQRATTTTSRSFAPGPRASRRARHETQYSRLFRS